MKSKLYMLLILSILCTSITGCSNDKQDESNIEKISVDNKTESITTANETKTTISAEESLIEMLEANKENNIETASSYLSNDYFEILDISKDEFISSMEKNRFESNLEITDYMIFNQQDIDDSTKRFDVSIKASDGSSNDYVYALTNKTGEWKVIPDGYLSFKDYSYESLSNDGLDMVLVKEIDSLTGKTLLFDINNNSSSSYSLGWASAPNIIVTTDRGNYTFNNPSPVKLEIGHSERSYINIPGAVGDIQKITMTNVNKLNNSGLPVDYSGGYEYVIYQK